MGFDPVAYINEPRWLTSRLGLERITELLHRLGDPQDRLRIIHVAGTNGKGSVSAFLASTLQAAGYVTGFFSSPYIVEFSDRIRVNGVNIPGNDLTDVTLLVKQAADAMEDHPTEFELMTAVAFLHFERSACEVAVVEVGMGGRLDSTNVIASPELCIITAIGFDHTDMLGTTLAEIAHEKAGIVKAGASVISWPQEPEAMEAIRQRVQECGARLCVPDFDRLAKGPVIYDEQCRTFIRTFDYRAYRALKIRLIGGYQPYNAALALEAVDRLRENGWDIDEEAVRRGFAATAWPSRFEVVGNDPFLVIDGAHNPQGAQALVDSLDEVFPGRDVVFIAGVLADKNYEAMLESVLPRGCALITVTPPSPRALSAHDLAAAASPYIRGRENAAEDDRENDAAGVVREGGASGRLAYRMMPIPAGSMEEALETAYSLARSDDVICVWGSLYLVSDIKAALRVREESSE